MATPPRGSAMSYKAQNAAAEATRAKATTGTGAASAELSPIDLQEMQGNEFLNDMIKGGSSDKGGALTQLPIPAEVRWRLLSSNDLGTLSALIFSQAAPAEQVTPEMLAVGSVYYNRNSQVQSHAEDQKEFGGANLTGMAASLQRQLPGYYDGQRYLGFHNAARFGSDLGGTSDVKAAVAAVTAAEQIMSGSNPFPQKYLYMDTSNHMPNAERCDAQSHTQIGQFHFWALKTEATTEQANDGTDTVGLLSATAAEPVL